MKVVITTEKELKDPVLRIEFYLDKERASIELESTCSKCAGYGCRTDNNCFDGKITEKLAPEHVASTLGPEATRFIESIYNRIFNKHSL